MSRDKSQRKGADPETRSVQGMTMTVTRDAAEFANTALSGKPAGLLVTMEGFVDAYGELLNTWGQQSFNVNAEQGPCRLVCASCDTVFSAEFVFRCGTKSAGAAFGMPAHTKCPDCGSGEAIIARLP